MHLGRHGHLEALVSKGPAMTKWLHFDFDIWPDKNSWEDLMWEVCSRISAVRCGVFRDKHNSLVCPRRDRRGKPHPYCECGCLSTKMVDEIRRDMEGG